MSKLDHLLFHINQSVRWLWRSNTRRRRSGRPLHVVYCMVDHYEPGHGGVDEATEKARVDSLLEKFPPLVRRYRDFDGRWPRRTWFFPPHYHRHGNLAKLVELCNGGYGEIELHLHHGKHAPDTAENLEATIRECVKDYAEFGIFGEVAGKRRYAFIHGDSALDNSRGGRFCGVNNEIDVLQRTGCYADFTHPSGPETSPSLTNAIFYAKGKEGIPKSYDSGTLAKAGGGRVDGLLLVQGPSHPAIVPSAFAGVRVVGDHVPGRIKTNAARVKAWVDTGVGLKGRDDLIFVKTSTHGAPFESSALGEDTELILRELGSRYNDGEQYRLHYVTARELFNLVRSIEDGRCQNGDIAEALNYEVTEPKYNTACRRTEGSPTLQGLVARTYRG